MTITDSVYFCLVCNAGYYRSETTCVMCAGNDIKSAIGDATDCSADAACDGSSYVANAGHTACGKVSNFSFTNKISTLVF